MSWRNVLYRELDIDWLIIKRKIKQHMNYLLIAQVAHEVNRAYCLGIGDASQKSWEEAEQWQRDSAVKGVEYKANNLSATPEDQHEAWSQSKIADGWVYGEVKDAEKKTHPCLVPYSELPMDQRVKDYLFVAVVGTMLNQQEAEKGAKIFIDTDVLKNAVGEEIPAEKLLNQTNTISPEVVQQKLSRGQIVMDINFNSGRQDIMNIKQACADAFDVIDKAVNEKYKILNDPNNPLRASESPSNPVLTTQGNDVGRLVAIAKTNLETASMYAVKAITR
jgi:hypothetical protein